VPRRPLLERIHNPRDLLCGCDPDCWCNRTALGRIVKWWFPAGRLGVRHKADLFKGLTQEEIREWRRRQEAESSF